MARDIIRSDKLWTPIWPYSYGTKVTGGTLLFMAGAISMDKATRNLGSFSTRASSGFTMAGSRRDSNALPASSEVSSSA